MSDDTLSGWLSVPGMMFSARESLRRRGKEIRAITQVGNSVDGSFVWLTTNRESIPVTEMKTLHIFNTFRMIWNNFNSPDRYVGKVKLYRFDYPYTDDYMRAAALEMFCELVERPDLPGWAWDQLDEMWAFTKRMCVESLPYAGEPDEISDDRPIAGGAKNAPRVWVLMRRGNGVGDGGEFLVSAFAPKPTQEELVRVIPRKFVQELLGENAKTVEAPGAHTSTVTRDFALVEMISGKPFHGVY